MELIIVVLVLLLTILTLLFSLRIFLNILKFKEAALGMIFTNLDQSIFYFKIYALAISILAISRCLDVVNIYQFLVVSDLATAMVIITDVFLVVVFINLSKITNIKKES